MPPTILIVGATGNTGRNVVRTLPKLLQSSKTLSGHRVLALTRSKTSAAAKEIAQLPGVEVAEYNWVEIDAAWLQRHEVDRIFIASHNEPNQFAEEGQFHVESLHAGVKYTVRISTTAANVVPDYRSYYPRTHWAIETMLSQPEFSNLHWSSLQPNVFFSAVLWPAAQYIKQYRESGKQGTLRLMLDADAPVGVVDPDDVGSFAAHLLAHDQTDSLNHGKYVMNGPTDITGTDIVRMVEQSIGVKVEDVRFRDMSAIEQWADSQTTQSKNLIRSIIHAPARGWEGKTAAPTTSEKVLELAPPRGTAMNTLQALLQN